MYDIGGRISRRCPISQFKDQTVQEALKLYRAYKHGHLPTGRTLDNETAFFCDIMYTCETYEIAAANWDMEQQQKKAEKQRKALKSRGR